MIQKSVDKKEKEKALSTFIIQFFKKSKMSLVHVIINLMTY